MIEGDFQQFWLSLVLSTPRILAATLLIPFLRTPAVPPMARNIIVFIIGLLLLPLVWQQSAALDGKLVFLLALKEALIGLLMGFIISLIFLIPQAVGDFIDNQRGASIASLFNPAFGGQASPFGLLLSQAFLVWFMVSGGLLLFFQLLFTSFKIVPIGDFFPTHHREIWGYIIDSFSLYLKLALVVAGPVVISMLLAEIALGLVSRFAPQLNVFFISMSLKSIIAVLILFFYFGSIMNHLWSDGLLFDTAYDFLRAIEGVK